MVNHLILLMIQKSFQVLGRIGLLLHVQDELLNLLKRRFKCNIFIVLRRTRPF